MNKVKFLVALLFTIDVYAQCSATYEEPFYICNYNSIPKITKLPGYSKGFLWFKKDINFNENWHEIEFDNLNIINTGTQNIKFLKNRSIRFAFYQRTELKYRHFKINYVCNDTPTENRPDNFVQIVEADSNFCKEYPDNSLID